MQLISLNSIQKQQNHPLIVVDAFFKHSPQDNLKSALFLSICISLSFESTSMFITLDLNIWLVFCSML